MDCAQFDAGTAPGTLYELAVMGAPSDTEIAGLTEHISRIIGAFRLRLNNEVALRILPSEFRPKGRTPAAVVFFGREGVPVTGLESVLASGVPVLPIASTDGRISDEIPIQLRKLNCLTSAHHGLQRIATAVLECVGLLPRQRRVFVSYRRDDARQAALQLFNAFSARLFDVFLDTHGIAPAEDFQAVLWHRLCDSDVLVMLDTPGYFESRWTVAEFGRALAKGISVLRVGWPKVSRPARVGTASQVELEANEVENSTGELATPAVERICAQLEFERAQGQAVRRLNFFSKLQQSIECIGGRVVGVGLNHCIYLTLPDGTEVIAYPSIGVPTALTLNEALDYVDGRTVALVYDHIGLHQKWLKHLIWLERNIPACRWVKITEAAWVFGGWGTL